METCTASWLRMGFRSGRRFDPKHDVSIGAADPGGDCRSQRSRPITSPFPGSPQCEPISSLFIRPSTYRDQYSGSCPPHLSASNLVAKLPRRSRLRLPILQCAGVLARALRGAWRPYMRQLVEPMILTGLTDALVRALRVRQWLASFLMSTRHSSETRKSSLKCLRRKALCARQCDGRVVCQVLL